MTTQLTSEWLDQHNACTDVRDWLTKQGKERDGLKVLKKLRKCKLWDWYSWLAPRLMTHQERVLWACFCAKQVLPIFEKKYPKDKRPCLAIEAARKWANDPSEANRNAATYAADHAAHAADDAFAAYAFAAAHAAFAADNAAYAAANAAYATHAAYSNAAHAAHATYDAAKEKLRITCSKEAEHIIANSKDYR